MANGYSRPKNRRKQANRGRYDIHDNQTPLDYFGLVAKYVLIILLVMVFVLLCQKAYRVGYLVFSEAPVAPKGEGTEVVVEITSDMDVQDIGELLEQDGLLADGTVFPFQERFSSNHGKILPGTYTLSSDMTPEELIGEMSKNYPSGDEDSDVKGASSNLKESLKEVLR